jgi:phage baseplate assembly protein W
VVIVTVVVREAEVIVAVVVWEARVVVVEETTSGLN